MSGLRFMFPGVATIFCLSCLCLSCPAFSAATQEGILCKKCRPVADGFYQLCEFCGKIIDETVPTGDRSEIDFMELPGRPDPDLVKRLTSYSKLMARSRQLRENLRKKPRDFEGLTELAEVSRALDWYAMEAAVLERVRVEFPLKFDSALKSRLGNRYFYWARVLMHSREFEKASEIMPLARKNLGPDTELEYWTGKLLVALGKYAEARPYLENALKDPKLGKSADYLLKMAKGSEKYGFEAYSAYETGCGLLARGDRKSATGQFERALALNPSMTPASKKLADLKGNPKKAKTVKARGKKH